MDLYQTWPHDSPVEGEEPYLFWGHYPIIPFDNLYRRAYFVMHTFLVWILKTNHTATCMSHGRSVHKLKTPDQIFHRYQFC
jgi:hypothetical protein